MIGSDNFNIVVPFDISKSVDKKGNKVMRVGGIASTIQEDSDGEVLRPDGFKLDRFLNSAHINWNHKSSTDPESIIGEVDFAKATDKDLYIEGNLYPDSPMAKKVYALGKVLEKNSSSRKLGFSIEGKATKRNPQNPKEILEAELTGVAITHVPKNKGTNMIIIKSEEFDSMYPIIKGESGEEFIINEEDLVIDADLNIIKGGDIEEDKDEKEKAIAVDGGDSGFSETIPEDVEGSPYRRKMQKKRKNKEKILKKGEVYEEILSTITSDVEKAIKVFSLIEEISTMQGQEISNNTIEKAKEILNLAKSEEATSSQDDKAAIAKAEAAEALVKAQEAFELAKAEMAKLEKADSYKLVKGEMFLVKGDGSEELVGSGLLYKSMDEGEYEEKDGGYVKKGAAQASMPTTGSPETLGSTDGGAVSSEGKEKKEESVANDAVAKADEVADSATEPTEEGEEKQKGLKKSEDSDIIKAIGDMGNDFKEQVQALATLVDGGNSESEDLKKSIDAIKGVTDDLANRLAGVEKTKMPAKGVSGVAYKEKNFNGETLAKSEDAIGSTNVQSYSLSNRSEVVKAIFDTIDIEKGGSGIDQDIQRVISTIEMTGTLGDEPQFAKRVQAKLLERGIALTR